MLLAMAGALWVALVASVAAAITAVASPLSTWLVARGQRKADKAALIYHDKVDAYRAVSADAYHGQELLGDCAERLAAPFITDARAKDLVDLLDLDIAALHSAEPDALAKVGIVAPDSVIEARVQFAQTWNDATEELLYKLDRTAPGFAAKAAAAAAKAAADIIPSLVSLRKAMRDDLCS